MTEDLDDTVIVPPRPLDAPTIAVGPDLENTVSVPSGERARPPARPIVDRLAQPSSLGYSFRLGERGDAIALDVPAYVGRRPSPPRIASRVIPRLVRVPSPLKEVSSTHLEVRQLGASVIVTDLRSTNGSIVKMPGSLPRKLRQGESVVVSPGTLVDIGDGNILEILPMQRQAR